MSSEEWAQELFRKDIEQTPVSERKSFLFGIIENYCEGITYVRSSSAVGYSLLLHAIYAAQIVLKNPDFEIGELDETERFVHLTE